MTVAPRPYGAIDTLLWLGAGAVALVLIALWWLVTALAAATHALAAPRARPARPTAPPAPPPRLGGRPAGIAGI